MKVFWTGLPGRMKCRPTQSSQALRSGILLVKPGAVAGEKPFRASVSADESVEDATDPMPEQRAVNLHGQPLAGGVVHDVQRPDPPTAGQPVADEAH